MNCTLRHWLFGLAAVGVFTVVGAMEQAKAQSPLSDNARLIADCLNAAADVHHVPPAVLVVLLNVEGGSLGHVSPNTNATVDIGPMQVTQIWIPQVAAHWHATQAATFVALRDNFCANVEAGAWILRQGLDEARGDFWQGVGYYHSHDPQHKAIYLQAVLKQVLRLRAVAESSQARQVKPLAPPAARQTAANQPAGR
jgi:hypothetical protein